MSHSWEVAVERFEPSWSGSRALKSFRVYCSPFSEPREQVLLEVRAGKEHWPQAEFSQA